MHSAAWTALGIITRRHESPTIKSHRHWPAVLPFKFTSGKSTIKHKRKATNKPEQNKRRKSCIAYFWFLFLVCCFSSQQTPPTLRSAWNESERPHCSQNIIPLIIFSPCQGRFRRGQWNPGHGGGDSTRCNFQLTVFPCRLLVPEESKVAQDSHARNKEEWQGNQESYHRMAPSWIGIDHTLGLMEKIIIILSTKCPSHMIIYVCMYIISVCYLCMIKHCTHLLYFVFTNMESIYGHVLSLNSEAKVELKQDHAQGGIFYPDTEICDK